MKTGKVDFFKESKPRKTEEKTLSYRVAVNFTEADYTKVEALAELEGLTITAFVRKLSIAAINKKA